MPQENHASPWLYQRQDASLPQLQLSLELGRILHVPFSLWGVLEKSVIQVSEDAEHFSQVDIVRDIVTFSFLVEEVNEQVYDALTLFGQYRVHHCIRELSEPSGECEHFGALDWEADQNVNDLLFQVDWYMIFLPFLKPFHHWQFCEWD